MDVQLPGRLGTPDMELRDDPRADPRMIAALAPLGLDGRQPPLPLDYTTPLDDLLAFAMEAEAGFQALGGALALNSPPVEGVTTSTETIAGSDGNDITLYIHRPAAHRPSSDDPLPCIVHTHGGGMVMLTAADPGYVRWRDELAAIGLIVIGVEFRNGAGALGPHPFPAGLNDCAAAARWAIANAGVLGAGKVIMSGESGGGNLSLATALKAKQEGWIDGIAGVYAQCPYIYGGYADPTDELASLVENNDYFLNVDRQMGALALVYDPSGEHATDPLAWPYHAETADLEGLPPHVVSVNELDPLRDEGLTYARKLAGAGVSVVSRTVNGTCHAGDCLLRDAMADVYLATIRDIKSFADSL